MLQSIKDNDTQRKAEPAFLGRSRGISGCRFVLATSSAPLLVPSETMTHKLKQDCES
jgi:hypothetical protein